MSGRTGRPSCPLFRGMPRNGGQPGPPRSAENGPVRARPGTPATGPNVAEQLRELSALRDSGALDDVEFAAAAARLARSSPPPQTGPPQAGPRPQEPGPGPSRTRWILVLVSVVAVAVAVTTVVVVRAVPGCRPEPAALTAGADAWSTDASGPAVGRYLTSATAGCDGRIYLIGGMTTPDPADATSSRTEPSVEVFDPVARTWSAVPSMPTPRVALAAPTGPDGRIYAIGGEIESADGFPSQTTVEVYDPDSGAWASAAPLPQPMSRMGAVRTADGRILVVGDRAAYVYDPADDSWSARTAMPTPRHHLMLVPATDGRVYALGGFTTDGQLGEYTVVESYDPASDTWRSEPPMPTGRAEGAGAATADGRIIVSGGRGASGTSDVYDVATATWSPGPPIPGTRRDHVAAVGSDGRLYLVGGAESTTSELPRDVLVYPAR